MTFIRSRTRGIGFVRRKTDAFRGSGWGFGVLRRKWRRPSYLVTALLAVGSRCITAVGGCAFAAAMSATQTLTTRDRWPSSMLEVKYLHRGSRRLLPRFYTRNESGGWTPGAWCPGCGRVVQPVDVEHQLTGQRMPVCGCGDVCWSSFYDPGPTAPHLVARLLTHGLTVGL